MTRRKSSCTTSVTGRQRERRQSVWARLFRFHCLHCGQEFKPLRISAKFCSHKCRVYWHRQQGCYASPGANE
jgi:hypothetical protein